jgi:bifunctional enzyme CysN/CysC
MMGQELLRFITAGSVDDGKSTLIGRLLYDSGGVYEDQLKAARKASRDGLDLAFITDGLRAEREQGITIDVAYRYFATPKRKFIIADTPGHEQYTRNMATGASTAQLAIVLMDARKGLLPQTVRHLYIAWLLGIRHIVVAINKMDLVGLRREVFESIQSQFESVSNRLAGNILYFVPVVAPDGDNVVQRSPRMQWFQGPSLLEYLETVTIDPEGLAMPFRMAVQSVVRCDGELRGYAGKISSGCIATGEEVIVLPSRHRARIEGIPGYDGELAKAFAPMSTLLLLDQHLDVSRGDMLADSQHPPHITRNFAAHLVWMSEIPLTVGRPYLIKHLSQYVCATVSRVTAKLDITTLGEHPADELLANDIGTVEIEIHRPLFCDLYAENRETGSFILIDPVTNLTIAAGMIVSVFERRAANQGTAHLKQGLTVWLTGLSSAGKSTLSQSVYERLWARGIRVEMLDGDEVRRNFSRDLSFSKHDRDENIRRIGFLAELLTRNGVIALVSVISPYRAVREEIRSCISNFLEVYVNAPLAVCEERDVKGLYHKARTGEIAGFTGIDDPYEPPIAPEVECRTDLETVLESVDKIILAIEARLA